MSARTLAMLGLLALGTLLTAPAVSAGVEDWVTSGSSYTTSLGGKCNGYVDVICQDGNTGPGGPTCEAYLSDTCRVRI